MHQLLRAAERREEREWRRTAQLAVWIMQPWTKKRMSVDKLLKLPKRPKPPILLDPRE